LLYDLWFEVYSLPVFSYSGQVFPQYKVMDKYSLRIKVATRYNIFVASPNVILS